MKVGTPLGFSIVKVGGPLELSIVKVGGPLGQCSGRGGPSEITVEVGSYVFGSVSLFICLSVC